MIWRVMRPTEQPCERGLTIPIWARWQGRVWIAAWMSLGGDAEVMGCRCRVVNWTPHNLALRDPNRADAGDRPDLLA